MFFSEMIFTSPSVSLLVLARELATMGNDPTLYSIPSALQSSSVFPTHATSGWV